MLRAKATDSRTGRTIIVLGLEEGNIERLRKGHPIHIHADELGFAGEITIFLGKDADELQKLFAPMIGPETNYSDRRQEKKQ